MEQTCWGRQIKLTMYPRWGVFFLKKKGPGKQKNPLILGGRVWAGTVFQQAERRTTAVMVRLCPRGQP